MEPLRQDHVTLLAVDAERSLHGLLHSLSMGLNGMPKGALHAADLVSGLASVGLAAPSNLMQEVAQALSAGQPMVMEIASDFARWLEQRLQEIKAGNALDQADVAERVTLWARELQAMPNPVGHSSDHFVGHIQGLPVAEISSAGSATGLPKQAFQKNGLDLIQYARVLNRACADKRSIQRIDNLLSELQDQSLQIGQKSLRELYDQHHSVVDNCWLDADVFEFLAAFRTVSDRTQHISAVQRNLTLLVDWHGITLENRALQDLSSALAQVHGRLVCLDNGYRLVFPCSQRRMCLQPYLSEGRAYAISAAQMMEAFPSRAETTTTLKACAGLKRLDIPNVELHAQESMNLHPIPLKLPRPPGVTAVAINGQGDLFLFRSLVG